MGLVETWTLIAIVLKLTGVVAWSWWGVLMPLAIYAGILFSVIMFYAFYLFVLYEGE